MMASCSWFPFGTRCIFFVSELWVDALNAGNLERNRPIALWADQWVLFDNAGVS